MSPDPLHLGVELLGLAGFAVLIANALAGRGARGVEFLAWGTLLGLVRENYVAIHNLLYGLAPLSMMAGRAPLLGAIVWPLSIYCAVAWSERMTGEQLEQRDYLGWRFYAGVAAFLVALAFLYEPFLAEIGLARWEGGTVRFLDVPAIAFIGYPTLALAFLWIWRWRVRDPAPNWRKGRTLFLATLALAIAHARALVALKDFLAW